MASLSHVHACISDKEDNGVLYFLILECSIESGKQWKTMSSNAMYFLLTQISNLTSTETQEVILCNWILIS